MAQHNVFSGHLGVTVNEVDSKSILHIMLDENVGKVLQM